LSNHGKGHRSARAGPAFTKDGLTKRVRPS